MRAFALIAIFIIPGPVLVAQETKLKLDPIAVKVVRKTYGDGFSGLVPFNTQKPGTAVAVLVESPRGGLIKISPNKSKLESFTDDKGTNLIGKGRFGADGIGSFPRISQDGKAGLIEINGSKIPASGATAIKGKGTLQVALATTKKKLKSKKFVVKDGAKITVGKMNFVIKKTGKPDFGDNPFQITFETKNDLATVHEFRFEDASGKAIKSQPAGTSRFGFNNNFTINISHSFERKLSECVMVLDVWTDMRDVKVPFDFSAGIGN